MESALSFLAGLVDDVVGDVGKGSENKNNEYISPLDWDPAAICAIDAANSAEDYALDDDSVSVGVNDMEWQDHHQDDDYGMIKKSASNTSNRRTSNRKSFSSVLKSKGSDLLQSFSRESRNPPPPLEKFSSSFSDTDNETAFDADISFNQNGRNDDSDFDWANSLSNQDPQKASPRRLERPELPPPPKTRHIEWWAHGIIWTCMAVGFGWMGVGFSILARQSTSFVTLREPMYLDPRYETIPSFGMIQLELCFNDTHLDILEEVNDNDNIFGQGLEPPRLTHPSQSESRAFDVTVSKIHEYNDDIGPSVVDEATTPCIIHRMTSDDVYDDTKLKLAQSVTFLAMSFGGFVTTCLTFSVFWRTINLRPIGFGFLLAYFMQSFTFLIFDTNFCKDNDGCIMSRGGYYSIVASICWILSCAASSRMEKHKLRNEQKQIEIVEEQFRQYFAQRKAAQAVANRLCPKHIVIQKESHPSPPPSPPVAIRNLKKESREVVQQPPKPTPIDAQNRATTAETANETTDEESSSSFSDENQNILQDLKELNPNPAYIPTLPQDMPQKASSALSLNKKSEEPRSMSSMSKDKIDTNIDTNIENKGLKKPRSTKSKSKRKKKNILNVEVERSKKSRSKNSKSKDKKNGKQDVDESSESQPSSASSDSSATLATNLEPVKELRRSKKMKESYKNGQNQQERPRSSRKSRKLDSVVDVKHGNSDKNIDDNTIKNEAFPSTIDSSVRKEGKTKKKKKKSQQQNQKEKKQSSSRTNKSKDGNSSSRTFLHESNGDCTYFEL